MPTVGVLNVAIRGDAKGLRKSIGSVGSLLGGLRGHLGKLSALFGGLSAAGAFAAFNKMSKNLDALAKAANTLGVTTEQLSELRFAAQRSGIEVAGLETSLQRLRRSVGEASLGKGTGGEALAALNIEADALMKMPIQEQLFAISRAMKEIPNASQRIAIGFQLFGRQGVNLIRFMQKGDQELRDLIDNARQFGATVSQETAVKMERFQDATLNLRTALGAMGREVADVVSPFMIVLAEDIAGLAVTGNKSVRGMISAFSNMDTVFGRVINHMANLAVGFAGVLDQLAGGFAQLVGEIAQAASEKTWFSEGTREFLKVLAEEEFAAAAREESQGAERLRAAALGQVKFEDLLPASLTDFLTRVERVNQESLLAAQEAVQLRQLGEAGESIGELKEDKGDTTPAIAALERGSAEALGKIAEIFSSERARELAGEQLREQKLAREALERIDRNLADQQLSISVQGIA